MNLYSSNLVGKFCLIYDEKDLDEKIEFYKDADDLIYSGSWLEEKVKGLLHLAFKNDINLKQLKCEIVFINDVGQIQVKLPDGRLYEIPNWQRVYLLD